MPEIFSTISSPVLCKYASIKQEQMPGCCRVQVFESFYDFLVDNEAQQGASLYTLKGLLDNAANSSLLLLNGDVSYAR